MRRVFPASLSVLSAAVLSLASMGANATDISNHDAVNYTIMVTANDVTKTIVLDANSDLAEVCEGCEIFMEDGQIVQAKNTDMVIIAGGELSIAE
ncbi:hypothetical protein [Magnetovibrio blakemorei]|nr:hypothetical protein [Magnetovibrio blakemorei]